MAAAPRKVVVGAASPELLEAPVARSLDTRGMVCPYPAFETVKALNQLRGGDVLEVLTDSDISAKESIPTVLQTRGYPFVVVEQGGEWTVRVRKP